MADELTRTESAEGGRGDSVSVSQARHEGSIPERRGGGFLRLMIVSGLIAFAIVAAVVAYGIYRVTGPVMSATITRQFTDSLPTVGSADGILETATANVPETFSQSDSATLLNVIPLGTNVSEIRVPAIYRYHIRLYDPWKIMVSGNVCLVIAPQFEPSLPPAIVTDRMEKSTSAGWLRFDAEDDLAALEQGLTAELTRRADDKTHRDFVREACRQSVANFVKTWLMKEDYWRTDKFHQIVVAFPDEVTPSLQAAGDGRVPVVTYSGSASLH